MIDEMRAKRQNVIEAMDALDQQLASIRTQIAAAKNDAHAKGIYAGTDWYRRVHLAAAHKGRERQSLQIILGDLNRKIKKAEQEAYDLAWERTFIRAAKTILPSDQYESIVAATHAATQREAAE